MSNLVVLKEIYLKKNINIFVDNHLIIYRYKKKKMLQKTNKENLFRLFALANLGAVHDFLKVCTGQAVWV